jgi:serine/threonine protein kinase
MTHPHIVRAYEVLELPEPVVVLETLKGATLSYLIEDEYERRGLPFGEVVALGLHLCSALAYLHSERLLHLDLKPSNIVSELGRAKVIDLSIARRPGRAKKGCGTRVYMAPEQAVGGMLSDATDIWGLGGRPLRGGRREATVSVAAPRGVSPAQAARPVGRRGATPTPQVRCCDRRVPGARAARAAHRVRARSGTRRARVAPAQFNVAPARTKATPKKAQNAARTLQAAPALDHARRDATSDVTDRYSRLLRSASPTRRPSGVVTR